MPPQVRWLRALANLSGPGYCLANWRLALRYWTADIIMAVSFVSDPEPTWQMIGALLRCKQCKPGIFSVKSGDKPPKMKQRFCDSLYSVCRVPGPRLMCWRGWWGPGAASSRIPRESPESDGSWHSQVIFVENIWSTFYILPVALSLRFCSKYLSLLVGKSLSLPWSFIDDESKTLWVVIKQKKTWRVCGKELGQENSWQAANENPVGVKPGQCDLWWGDELDLKLN